jgi:AcrR family transcriptional regulator
MAKPLQSPLESAGRGTRARDPVGTRQALLDAAAQVLAREGATASLETIAAEAGVSKGGLLHHFPSKEALLVGLVAGWLTHFDEAIKRHLDPADRRPGRLTRAHIRASFDDSLDDEQWRNSALIAALLTTPSVLDYAHQVAQQTRVELVADGLHPQRLNLILRALDGYLFDQLFVRTKLPLAEQSAEQELLLSLSEQSGPITH